MNTKRQSYPGGISALNERYNSRREPFVFYKESLPDLDADLHAFSQQTVPQTATQKLATEPQKNSSWANKRRAIATEFVGNSQLAYLNAMLIANLRKKQAPVQAAPLFLRLWREQSAHLIDVLDLRWKVSSIMTFADHGDTDVQRQVGQALRMLFGMMKLYEFERLFSGTPPDTAHPFKGRIKANLPMDMDPYSLQHGGLDINLLAPVWTLSQTDPVIAPLANHLFETLNDDPATVFRRLAAMRDERARIKASK